MKHDHFHKIGIITKHTIADHLAYLKKIIALLEKQEKEILLDTNASPLINKKPGFTKSQLMRRADMVIVLGGDGTLLKLSRKSSLKSTPVLGVNMGQLGFLTELSPQEIFKALPRIFAGNFVLDERFLLRVTIYRAGKKINTSLALNEAVINQGSFARLISLRTEVNKRLLTTFRADGLIVSTPTGSTGHSLSAGGPIVHPKLQSLLLTPICPVKISSRPILVPNDRQIIVVLQTKWRAEKKAIALTIDGQVVHNLYLGDEIRIRKSSRVFQMIRLTGQNYYQMLREKLSWGG